MNRINKNYPCSIEVWCGADDPILKERDLYFSNKKEVIEYLNSHLQKYKGEDVECYVYQFYNNMPHESTIPVSII
jgi:hypothetical protein